ncbi:MAG: RNA-binding protein [Anaerolineales bacterium]|nr:RNA-binding protein [Anaerolineales bacterium]
MTKKVYVGNLSFQATEQQVRDLFAEFGTVESIAMINDRDTGRFRGFCFVEMADAAATKAIAALDGREIDGRNLRVNEAQPREERGGGNRGGGGYRSGGGGGYRGGGSGGGGNRGGGNRGGGSRDGGNRNNRRSNDYSDGGGW